MTGLDPLQPVTAAVRADSFRIWEKNRARVEQDIVEGRPFDAFVSERGRFDAMIDPESLLNHLGRFTEQDLEAGFGQHLKVIRSKRWLRGGVYAVDGHDIVIPYGQGYEGAHPISEGAYGYKLLVLLNIQDECELIVGYILGGLPESEITLLRRLLARLDKTMGPLREWLKILLMDRGYWGTDLFCESQTGLRHRFREPGAGPEVGGERLH